jgi:type IX secretion system PorP/SprF family membrane protein
MRKFFSLFISAFISVSLCNAQQVPVYSQYILNEFLINPSVAGIDGMTTFNVSGRMQWFGVKHAPETYSASFSTRILKSPLDVSGKKLHKGTKGRVGLGAAFVSDRNGAISRTNLQLTYAYHIFIGNNQLSFGLKGYATQFKIDEDLIELDQPDPYVEEIYGKSTIIPDAGAGISFSSPNSHIGFSVSELLQSAVKFGDLELDSKEFKHLRQYSLYGYTKKSIQNSGWEVEPSILIRGNEELRFSADFSTRFIYQKEYWAGLSVRSSGELILLLGLKMNRFLLGYSFDYGFNQLSYRSYGSHELFLAYRLGDSLRRYKWLERY